MIPLRAHGQGWGKRNKKHIKFSPARPKQAGKKMEGVLGEGKFLPACLSCEAGLRISARHLRRRAVKGQRRDFLEKRFEF